MLPDATLALRDIPGEEDDDGMEIRTGQAADPMVGVIGACIVEYPRPGRHALAELFGEGRQR